MRIKITLYSKNSIVLPKGFIKYIQGLIYNLISDEWLHDIGFSHGKASFKLFTFSSFLEKPVLKNSIFFFPKRVNILVSSPVDWIMRQLASGVINTDTVRIGDNILEVEAISILKPFPISNELKVKTITPVELHTTEFIEGKRKTHFLTPYELEFYEMMVANLKRKWESFYKKSCPYTISVESFGKMKEKILYYGTGSKALLIKAWMGVFVLKGDKDFISFSLDTGLGSRNSQGFGMISPIK